MRSRASKSQFQELCYGIPVELIALWLEVSATVAHKYKNGSRAPCSAAFQLFKLKLEGRVVPDEWHGFSFRGGQFFGPDNRAFTHGHLRAYGLGMQLMREYARGDFKRNAEVDRIFAVASLDVPALTHGKSTPSEDRLVSKSPKRCGVALSDIDRLRS